MRTGATLANHPIRLPRSTSACMIRKDAAERSLLQCSIPCSVVWMKIPWFGVRAVIGKGGMGKKTLNALHETGAVYLNAIGGAAQFYAEAITAVEGVDFLDEFGIPEAMWRLRVQDFVAVVTMDSHGNSLHADVEAESLEKLGELAPA